MSTVALEGRLLRWGNSFGLRISRHDVERLRLRADQEVQVRIDISPARPIRARDAHTFDLGGDAADRHDELAARAAIDDLESDG